MAHIFARNFRTAPITHGFARSALFAMSLCVAGCSSKTDNNDALNGSNNNTAGHVADARTAVPPPVRDASVSDAAMARDAAAATDPVAPSYAAILESSYSMPEGNVYELDLANPELNAQASHLLATHNDAVVRSFGAKLYVVNRAGSDSVHIYDTESGAQASVAFEANANPQDIAVLSASLAFVSLYDPVETGDIAVINPSTQSVLERIDLTPFSNDDGDRLAKASPLAVIGGYVFVGMQDLSSSYVADANGKIAVIDPDAREVTDVIHLEGRNPVAMTYSPQTEKLYVSNAGVFDTMTGGYNLADQFGGIEVVDPTTRLSEGIRVADEDLTGSPWPLTLSSNALYTVASIPMSGQFTSVVLRMSLEALSLPESIFNGTLIQDIAWAEATKQLLIADRTDGAAGIYFTDAAGNIISGPLSATSAPSSIALYAKGSE